MKKLVYGLKAVSIPMLILEGANVGCSSIFLMDLCEYLGEWQLV